jgi:hypothetical protein
LFISGKSRNFALVIELERHIEILLLSNDCVIVPGLGGFMAHHVEACYNAEDHLFLPPLRTLGFNPQLRLNDHLLVQSYIEAYDISYPEALRRIEEEVDELKQHIETDGEYELHDIGTLRLNDEGHYEFEPCEAGILTPDFYGLSTFEMPLLHAQAARAAEKAQVVEISQPAVQTGGVAEQPAEHKPEQQDADERTIVIRMSWLRNAAAVVAAFIIFLTIGTPVSNSDSAVSVQESSVLSAVTALDTNLAKLTHSASEGNKAQHGKETGKAETKMEKGFTIVLASQTTRHLAESFVTAMKKAGFGQVRIAEMNNSNKVRVICGCFVTADEAYEELRNLRHQDRSFKEAWVLELK